MTRNELQDALDKLLPSQLEALVYKLGVPAAYLPGPSAAPALRIIDLLRWAEEQGRLADVERLYFEVRALRATAVSGPGGKLRKRRALIAVVGVALCAAGGGLGWLRVRHPPQRGIKLIWAPSDCPQKEPRIAYGSCNELRELPWLEAQLNGLRQAGVSGFEPLGLDPKLEPATYHEKENWLLYLEPRNGGRFLVGVGFDRDTQSPDGCLHIYDTHDERFRAAVACLDANGHWWTNDGWLGTYRHIDPAIAHRK